jgi:hypothetical protein
MLATTRAVHFDPELVEEAEQRVGPEEFDAFVNTALRQYLQALRLREHEAELAGKYGPIPDDVAERARKIEWPV